MAKFNFQLSIGEKGASTNNVITVGPESTSGKLDAHVAEADTKINALQTKVAGAFKFAGKADSFEELLELTDVEVGEVFVVGNKEYAYDGEQFVELGFGMDLTGYATTASVNQALNELNEEISVKADKNELFSGSWNDLTDKPTLFDGSYNSLSDKPELFDGSYNSLEDKPAIPSVDGLASDVAVASRYDILLSRIAVLEDKIFAAGQTNVEEYADITTVSDASKDAVISVENTVTVAEVPSHIATITAKTVQVKELTVDSIRLNIASEGDVSISNFESEGSLAKSISNASTSINTDAFVTIKDCVIGQDGYNAIEIGLTAGKRVKGVNIENVHFAGKFTNNVVSVFDTADNAIINITNCVFDDCSNPIRLSNRSGGKVTLNLVNCEFTQIEGDHAGGSLPYNGIVICQDYTSTSAAAAVSNNLFGPDKVTINMIGCTHAGEPIKCDDPAEICGTQDANQMIYVYADKGGNVAYSVERYPVVTAK